jgi:hypothetical protein
MVFGMASSRCARCNSPLAENARFCGQCGALSQAPPAPTKAEHPLARTVDDPAPPSDSLASTIVDSVPNLATPVVGVPAFRQEPLLDQTIPEPEMPTARPAQPRSAQSTMLGFAMPSDARPPQPSPGPPADRPHSPAVGSPPNPQGPAFVGGGVKKTMIGVAAIDMAGGGGQNSQAAWAASRPPAPSPSLGAPSSGAPSLGDREATAADASPETEKGHVARTVKGTMLGVAIPGIAPTHAGQQGGPTGGASGTMLGVAVPGIAPTRPGASASEPQHAQLRRAVEIVPKPTPPVDEEAVPAPPIIRPKRGVPLGMVAGVTAALVLVAGVTTALLWKNSPLVAQPRVDAQGHEQLHLRCETCEDGTTAELSGSRATFKGKECDLAIVNSLKVGDNPLIVHLDRPKLGRDEAVKLVVPIAFRIRADLGDLTAARPLITVRVEALSGTDVRVDGKPVALDGSGAGAYAIDISSETEGPADDTRLIDRTIPYVITPKAGGEQKGNVTARMGVTPLHLDAPGLHAVIDTPTFHLAGRVSRGGSLSANGRDLRCDPDGAFTQPFDAPALGDLPVELRATAPQLAPRTAHIGVKRVAHLADEGKARELLPQLTYDGIVADIAGSVGKSTVVEGEVVEARFAGSQTVAVIDDVRGCSKSPCLVRVVYGGDDRFKHSDVVRAFGRVTRAVTAQTGTVPEVEADFILRGPAPR